MRRRFPAFSLLAAVVLASESAASAENRIDIWRGADTIVQAQAAIRSGLTELDDHGG